ncbi:replication-associated recombination protein A [Acholeplasma sp. OttesenSCG-928-E16]|nr:replication-associated recombination protein A [Acholeplasma sp. OttesenSCG-928-E16]
MQPLAYRMRPESFDDVFGQEHLVGKNGILRKMIHTGKWMSFILYGPPGCGKTTVAYIFAKEAKIESFTFNASTDNKAKLKDIIDTTAYHDVLLIIDEIHRMKADIQDYLLPFMESGKVTVIGLTTVNPYQSINMAIRSRCHLYQIKPLEDKDLKEIIKKAITMLDDKVKITDKAIELIIRYSNHEVRTALNILESASMVLVDDDTINIADVKMVAGKPMHNLDDHEDNYYELLSALQKSIRGSDVDASLHYLARLITLGDIAVILRRLMVIVYEDIGLANPNMGPRMQACYEAVMKLGMPEALNPLSVMVIDMALSPKSNTAIIALTKAIDDYQNHDTGTIPPHADNKKIKMNPAIYSYPHDDVNSLNSQSYLPEKIRNRTYYYPKRETSYEKALAERLDIIDKIKGKKRAPSKK